MVNDPRHPVGAKAGPTHPIQARYDRMAAIVDAPDPTPAELIAFLNGEGSLEGAYFGEAPVRPGGKGGPLFWRHYLPLLSAPIPMVLHCPACGVQHIDQATDDWPNPPHRSHLCGSCGCIWRPADVPTVGVQATQTKGKADNYHGPNHVERVPLAEGLECAGVPVGICTHAVVKAGPRIPLAWGSSATLVCKTCGRWRQDRPGFDDRHWQEPTELERALANDDSER